MELIRGLHNLAPRHRGSVVSIGNFDGLHRGHQALIERLHALSAQHGLPSTVLMFEPMPREYFAGDAAPPRIDSLRSKLRGLEALGIDRVLCLRFDARLAAMSGEDFIRRVLLDGLDTRAVIVGDDFRYGYKRSGDLALLQKIGAAEGFTAEGLGTVALAGERFSSTALRSALTAPDLARAAKLLGRRYRMRGRVRHGLKLGRTLDMPTANLTVHHRAALAHGVYAVRAYWPERPEGVDGVASIGVRPTLAESACLLETHLFDFSGLLYGLELEIEFHQFLRPQVKFDSLDALKMQMQVDGAQARAVLETDATPID
jgi:riboflavin kinase/FMN adenylyltransferase